MFSYWKRGLAAALIIALTLTMGLPALASGSFAQVLISAEDTDFPTLDLDLSLYRRSQSNTFSKVEDLDFVTPVNRVTKDVQFHLTPETQQVTLTVDYLTDLNGDGVYELLSGQDNPVGDVLSASGALTSASSGVSTQLTQGHIYTITGQMLLERGQAVLQDRTTPGSSSYLAGLTGSAGSADSILYMITVSDGSQELCYYLRLYDQIPAPSAADFLDVPAGAWYYDAVDYVVSHGLLSGSARSTFSPNQKLTRAMLAQTLYNLAGQPNSTLSHYTDVSQGDWCYSAVSWTSNQKIMTGTSDRRFSPNQTLTRQELALTLFLYTQNAGLSTSQRADLGGYADQAKVASWARDAMEWAVARGLLTGRSSGGVQTLDPTGSVTRAEVAAVLQTLCEDVLA